MNPIKIEYENLYKVNKPFITDFKKKFSEVLNTGWFILGDEVLQFEKEFAKYTGATYCVSVASGLDALILSILALDLEKGSEIIVPSNTYIASILAIIHAGCTPVLVEPDIQTYNIDPDKINKAITKKTKAVMVVHLYGKMCDMDPIVKVCKDHNLFLLEDCAQAHGAEYKGKKAGTFGDLAAFSFYPTKNLGALGDAGCVLTRNERYMYKLKAYRNYGSDEKYHNTYIGYNSRMDEIQAAFLRIKLEYLDEINKHKRKLAEHYFNGLKNDFILPMTHHEYQDVYHIFNIRHPERDRLRTYLKENGVGTEIHYPIPPHKQEALKHILNKHYPFSEKIHQTTLSLPISYAHTHDDIENVIKLLNNY